MFDNFRNEDYNILRISYNSYVYKSCVNPKIGHFLQNVKLLKDLLKIPKVQKALSGISKNSLNCIHHQTLPTCLPRLILSRSPEVLSERKKGFVVVSQTAEH